MTQVLATSLFCWIEYEPMDLITSVAVAGDTKEENNVGLREGRQPQDCDRRPQGFPHQTRPPFATQVNMPFLCQVRFALHPMCTDILS